MSPPPAPHSPHPARPAWLPWSLLLATGLAYGLRLLRLGWQPLWWDEGYSIYFATEPLGRMLWLTAHDIHPPLYYALLHGWSLLFGPEPAAARAFSVAIGTVSVPVAAWLALTLWPGRARLALIAALLLAGLLLARFLFAGLVFSGLLLARLLIVRLVLLGFLAVLLLGVGLLFL